MPRRFVARGLRTPLLAIIDGNAGLRRAVELVWPRATVQRCCVHKLRNLERKAPKYTLAEIRDDFHRIVYVTNADAARTAYTNLRAHVGQTLPGRGDKLARGRGRTPHVLSLPESAVEDAANHEHD